MSSVIIIAPDSLAAQADALAVGLGLPAGQLTQDYDDSHRFCHFQASEAFSAALAQPLPAWVQVIDTDAPSIAWNEAKVGVFLSALDGWVFKDVVDGWARS